jgi:hypothetical protein
MLGVLMITLRRTRKIILLSAVLLATGAGVAYAATTWTITPGGNIQGSSGKTTFTDASTGIVLTCTSTDGSATAKSGSGLTNPLASGLSASASNCTGPLGITFTLTAENLPWNISAASFDASTGVAKGTLSGIVIDLSGPSCSATIAGTTATSGGTVKGSYSDSTGQAKVSPTGGTLHVFNVDGCEGLIDSGDAIKLAAVYTITPKQTVTGS